MALSILCPFEHFVLRTDTCYYYWLRGTQYEVRIRDAMFKRTENRQYKSHP